MNELKPAPASSANELQIPEPVKAHQAWQRLEEQREWYANKSASCKNRYRGLRIAQVACAVMIPVFNLAEPDIAKWLTAYPAPPSPSSQASWTCCLTVFERPLASTMERMDLFKIYALRIGSLWGLSPLSELGTTARKAVHEH